MKYFNLHELTPDELFDLYDAVENEIWNRIQDGTIKNDDE